MNIGGYEVIRTLGKGGMSEVYEVEKISVGSRHALKLFTYPREEAEVRARFETEGKILAKLNHPRIVKVTDIGTDPASGKPYFVMDLVVDFEGEVKTLGDVQDGEADEETIGRWYDDIREGLAYIHAKGIVHRDLKLQNVMVGPDGHAVLTDFGISKIFDPEGSGNTLVDPVQTLVRMQNGKKPLMGSLGYMAPEIEMGVAASPKSDWYALGVIVYKLLTGVWCDARTDVTGTLETYDPVWGRIIPKLLHSNPQGRECLSYAEEKANDREEREAEWEEKWLREKTRSHHARHLARYIGGTVLALAIALGWMVHEYRAQREVWRLKFENAGGRPSVPTFDELFKTPAEAKADEQVDDDGNTIMYSRPQFEAAKVDALILAQPTLSALTSGSITLEKTIADFELIAARLEEDSEVTPFDNLRFGGSDYMQFGESGPLKVLFERALEKLRIAAEE